MPGIREGVVAPLRFNTRRLGLLVLTTITVVTASGCAQWRLPAIDPSGERIFLPAPNYTTLDNREGYVSGVPSPNPVGRALGIPGPVFPGATTPPDCPEDFVPPNHATADLQTGPDSRGCSTAPPVPRVMVPGCFQSPTGQTFNGLNRDDQYEGNVILKPRRLIAPVGSEVILVGGICDGEGFYKTREPIEWVLQEGSVGTFTEPGAVSEGLFGYRRPLGRMFSERAPELITQKYAVGCTSRKVQVLTRGTPDPSDDIFVLNGQGWIGLTSAQEGTSYVTLFGPNLEATTARQTNSVVHWIDGQWTLPPTISAQDGGPQTLTTTVTRKLTGAPIAGWIVQYEVVGGTPALLNGQSTLREVTTDSQGRATVQIVPEAGVRTGATQVQVKVIRPASGRGDPDRLVIGQGHTEVIWNATELEIRLEGPESVEVDGDASYRIDVHNPGNLPVSDATVRSMIPNGFDYVASTPQGESFGGYVDWNLATIEPGQTVTIDAIYRARQSGPARHCVTARSPSSEPVEDCVSILVTSDALLIDMTGPAEDSVFEVGEIVTYDIQIINRGNTPLSDIEVVDRFDAGLQQRQLSGEPREDLTDSIRRVILNLAPNASDSFQLNFVVVGPGRLCHTITACAQGVQTAERTVCFDAIEPRRRDFRVQITGPSEMTVGEPSDIFVDIENTGDLPLSDLQVIVTLPDEFDAIGSEPPTEADRGRVTWLTNESVPPGESLSAKFQVRVEPQFTAESSTIQTVVTGRDGLQRSDEIPVTILPRDPRSVEPPPRIPLDDNDENFGGDGQFGR